MVSKQSPYNKLIFYEVKIKKQVSNKVFYFIGLFLLSNIYNCWISVKMHLPSLRLTGIKIFVAKNKLWTNKNILAIYQFYDFVL